MNKLLPLFTLLLLGIVVNSNAQYNSGVTYPDKNYPKFSNPIENAYRTGLTITAADLKTHLTTIASKEMEGRETGQDGNNKAAAYLSNQFKSFGLSEAPGTSSYMQPVAFTSQSWDEIGLKIGDKEYRHLYDYVTIPSENPTDLGTIEDKEIIFLGYGIDDKKYSDYNVKSKLYKNKIIIINEGQPTDINDKNLLTGTINASTEWTLDKKLNTAKSKGVKMVIIITENFLKIKDAGMKKILGRSMALGDMTVANKDKAPHLFITSTLAKEIFGDKSDAIIKSRNEIKSKGILNPVTIKKSLNTNLKQKVNVLKSQNIVGYVKGVSQTDQYVVVSAHYDHIGKRGDEVFYGADDNGSGTSTILELAQAFSKAAKEGNAPSRNIVFLLVTGEEKGLLGSEYYVNNPLFPLEQTIVDVNVDMVGRVDEKYKDNPEYIYVIGSDRLSTELHKLNEIMNQRYTQLVLDYTYNDEKDPNRYYYRSDHYNFAERDIPSIFFFNGVHDDYHRTTDTVDKINFSKMESVARLIFHTTWELANRLDRISVNVK
jgi:hypothetical protein